MRETSPTATHIDGPFSVGDWRVEPALNRVSRDTESIQLELKVMDVLVCVAERAGEVVPRDTIVDSVWATEFIADNTSRLVVDPSSRFVAGGAGQFFPAEAVVRVWDLDSDQERVLNAGDSAWIWGLEFTNEGDLWVGSGSMYRRWVLSEEHSRSIEQIDLSGSSFSGGVVCGVDPDDRTAVFWEDDKLWIEDLDTHDCTQLGAFSGTVSGCAVFADDTLALATDGRGGILVGSTTGEPPHLVMSGSGGGFDVSPNGRWIASGGEDSTIRLWPMPDLSKPPLHNLPREELVAKLKTLTNLRVVRDEESPTGWTLTHDPFPGWETVPTW